MQAQTIKHEFLKIDGKITGVVLSKKEFDRLVKLINEINKTIKPAKKENKNHYTIAEIEKIRKTRKGKTVPVDQFFKKYL
ncbi:MAG: hypothetical protein KBA66_22465 [Leptospiraceae bacterium]|nr:hypothetical protein [Leptospiraceae bacterium]